MVGWHHQINGHGFGWTPGVGGGPGGLACCCSWGHKELDMTDQLNLTEINPLSDALFASIFSHSEGYLFIQFMVSFAV